MILRFLPFFSSIFFDNLFPKWCLRALLFIQPINVSELSEVDCKSMAHLFIVSKVLGGCNYWKYHKGGKIGAKIGAKIFAFDHLIWVPIWCIYCAFDCMFLVFLEPWNALISFEQLFPYETTTKKLHHVLPTPTVEMIIIFELYCIDHSYSFKDIQTVSFCRCFLFQSVYLQGYILLLVHCFL